MASGPITSWEIDGETVETVADFIFLSQIKYNLPRLVTSPILISYFKKCPPPSMVHTKIPGLQHYAAQGNGGKWPFVLYNAAVALWSFATTWGH